MGFSLWVKGLPEFDGEIHSAPSGLLQQPKSHCSGFDISREDVIDNCIKHRLILKPMCYEEVIGAWRYRGEKITTDLALRMRIP